MVEKHVDQSRGTVARIAGLALAQQMNGRDADVPRALVQAIASGTGDRAEVLEETLRSFGSDKPLELVLFDTDSIASYVFESSRPPVITGASTILRNLNSVIEDLYPRWTIFSGGGEGLLLVPSGTGRTVCRAIEDLYAERTLGALGVTVDFLPVGPQDFIGTEREPRTVEGMRWVSGTQAVLARLRDQIRRKKDERVPGWNEIAGGAERCASCRDRKAGSTPVAHYRDGELGRLCEPCHRRWEVGKEEIEGTSFEDLTLIFQRAMGLNASEGDKASYIGFLYVDGNAMGALFGKLTSLAELRFLSLAVAAVFERTRSRINALIRKILKLKTHKLPLVSYLGGGDEAIWIVPGALAVHIAGQLSALIQEESSRIEDLPSFLEKTLGAPALTFGAGLVICSFNYPVRYQYDLARSLQKNAKAVFYGLPPEAITSTLDFEILTDSSPLSQDLKSARKLAYGTEEDEFYRTCRPYTADNFGRILAWVEAAGKANLSKSQLYALQQGAAEGKKVFLNYLRYQIARKPAGPRYLDWLRRCDSSLDPTNPQEIEGFFIENPAGSVSASGTWVSDALQLAPFLAQLRERRG